MLKSTSTQKYVHLFGAEYMNIICLDDMYEEYV